ncbi:hypothetical protein K435DRAFT_970790 [Dendrothele bispora CBS 962.96]|uniref:Uncharacterized protein n=1 Tax=Dendrothele bispora (strain CBS 962.96) TaxID=1314807 RepID=A0A4S8L935_DENBC|nr:hypothetical protein K435DRAFT_970790 [Dendrothele bispora CBS 962.96]
METSTMTSVAVDSTVIDTIDHATTMQNNEADSSATTMTTSSVDVSGSLASGTPATTMTHEEDAQASRTVSSSTRTSIAVAQSMQMFNGSTQTEFINSVLSNVGGNKNETNIIYHIHGNATIHCPSTDSVAALRINSTGSSEILRETMSSQPEHVNHGDMRAGGTLATSTEENSTSVTGIQTRITTPRRVQRESRACADQNGCSSPRSQGRHDQQATSGVDRYQTSRVDITISVTVTELRFPIAFFF